MEAVLTFVIRHCIATLDLTGGAPELHPLFRELVSRARAIGVRVIDRCNLTILSEPGQEGRSARHAFPRRQLQHHDDQSRKGSQKEDEDEGLLKRRRALEDDGQVLRR